MKIWRGTLKLQLPLPRFSFMPKENRFFFLLHQSALNGQQIARRLQDLMDNFENVAAKVEEIKDLEDFGDRIIHDITRSLHRVLSRLVNGVHHIVTVHHLHPLACCKWPNLRWLQERGDSDGGDSEDHRPQTGLPDGNFRSDLAVGVYIDGLLRVVHGDRRNFGAGVSVGAHRGREHQTCLGRGFFHRAYNVFSTADVHGKRGSPVMLTSGG